MTVEQFNGSYRAKSPIAHGANENSGMEQQFRTMEMLVEEEDGSTERKHIPTISGNSLRGQLRDLLADDFLTRLDDKDDPIQIGDSLSNAFYSGGSLERGSGAGTLNRRLINDLRENIPMLSLFGTALADQLLKGKLCMGMFIPIAHETEFYTGREADHSVFALKDVIFYTRKDDRVGGRQEDETTQQMLFKVQCLIPGTELSHEMKLEDTTEIERACLGHAFDLFSELPHLGGKKAVGHGLVEYEYEGGLPDPEPYLDFVEDNREEIREYITKLDRRLQ